MALERMVSAPHISNEKITEKTSTITTKRCNSERSVQETLFLSSSKESLIYDIKSCIRCFSYFMHGLRGSNSRHLVLETSALPTELNPFLFDTKGVRKKRTPSASLKTF